MGVRPLITVAGDVQSFTELTFLKQARILLY